MFPMKLSRILLTFGVRDIGRISVVIDFGGCAFGIATVVMKCSRLCGWIFANLFHAFQASPVNFVQVISDNPIWTMAPNYGPLFK